MNTAWEFLVRTPELLIILVLLLIILGAWAAVKFRDFRQNLRHKGRLRRGSKAEKWAVQALEQDGFEILAEQAVAPVRFAIDGEWQEREVRMDILAKKEGELFGVEVKSGNQALDPGMATIRRQMLEYTLAFELNGILWADYEQKSFHYIEFEWGVGVE